MLQLNEIKGGRAIVFAIVVALGIAPGFVFVRTFDPAWFERAEFLKLLMISIAIVGPFFLMWFPMAMWIDDLNDKANEKQPPKENLEAEYNHEVSVGLSVVFSCLMSSFVLYVPVLLRTFSEYRMRTGILLAIAINTALWVATLCLAPKWITK